MTLAQDKSIPPQLQRKYLRRLGSPAVYSIDAGHLAMLSRPAEVVGAIENAVERMR
ncbi:MAG: hypothetical protein ACLFSP_11485 [Spirochaetaceae bacterium]